MVGSHLSDWGLGSYSKNISIFQARSTENESWPRVTALKLQRGGVKELWGIENRQDLAEMGWVGKAEGLGR